MTPCSRGLQHGAGGHRHQAARQPLPVRALPGVGQGEKPGAPGDRAGDADRPEQTAGTRLIEG
jgi:hypothetical protein